MIEHDENGGSCSDPGRCDVHGNDGCPGTPHRGHVHAQDAFCPLNVDRAGVDQSIRGQVPTVGVTEDPAVGVAVKWVPQARPEQSISELGMDEWVGQALGAASSCWSDLEGAGLFDSTRCAGIAKGLLAHFDEVLVEFVRESERRRKVQESYFRNLLAQQNAQLVHHDDQTLDKVRAGLRKAISGLTDKSANGIIIYMQNEGILFRERKDAPAKDAG